MASRLEYFCTNNQVKYEALLFSLEISESMDVKHVETFGDSLIVVHQVSRKYQCLDEFSIHHIYRHENSKANDLAQQVSGYNVSNKDFNVIRNPMCMHVQNLSLFVLGAETGLTGSTVGLTNVLDVQTGLIDTPTGLTDLVDPNSIVLENSASSNLEYDMVSAIDRRKPIIDYL
jgi:hypothetical protein